MSNESESEMTGVPTVWGVTIYSAGTLFHIAREALNRLEDVEDETSVGHTDALVSVLFAAASLEAFIMEFAGAAAEDAKRGYEPLAAVETLISQAESSKASTLLKFDLAHLVLAGCPYARGVKPHQDLAQLFAMRNEIVHQKTPKPYVKPHNMATFLVSRKLVKLPEGAAAFTTIISTKAVARWSCNVVLDVVASLLKLLPEPQKDKPLMTTHVIALAFSPPVS